MSADQAVFTAAAAAIVVAIALVTTGVAILAGMGWALIAAGVLLAVGSVGGATVLLREPNPQRGKP